MIALLQGTIAQIGLNQAIVLCGGVGYGVHVNSTTASQLSANKETTLYIHTHVREDALDLFGFATPQEKAMFELLLEVSGVGPKSALSILNGSPGNISRAVHDGDVSFFTQYPRIGKKLAQKIIIELKSKLGSDTELNLADASPKAAELREALASLGYSEQDVQKALQYIKVEELTIQQALKQSMKYLTGTK